MHSVSCVGARFCPAVLGQDGPTPGGRPCGLSGALYMGQEIWRQAGESLWEGRVVVPGARVQASKNMNFGPEAYSLLFLSFCPPGPGCDGDVSMVAAPPWAQLRLFHPDQAGKRHVFGSAVSAKSSRRAHSSVPEESVSSPDPARCHLHQAQGWPGGFGRLPGVERERHALCQWKFPAKSQEQVPTVSASSVSASPLGSRKPHSLSLAAQNLIYWQRI